MPTSFMEAPRKGAPVMPNPFELAKILPEGIAGAMPGLQDLASQINQFQQGQVVGQMEEMFPNLRPSLKQAGSNIQDMLQGMVPQDVEQSIHRSSAARAVGMGVPGSDWAGRDFAKNLGLTSLDMMGQGANQLNQMLPTVRGTLTAEPFDISQNIPNLTDIFNVSASQSYANWMQKQQEEALKLAQRGLGAGSFGGGGGMSINPGMPSLPGRQAAQASPAMPTMGNVGFGGASGGNVSSWQSPMSPMSPMPSANNPVATNTGQTHGPPAPYNPFAGALDYSPTTGYGGGFSNPYGPQGQTNIFDTLTNPTGVGLNYDMGGSLGGWF